MQYVVVVLEMRLLFFGITSIQALKPCAVLRN